MLKARIKEVFRGALTGAVITATFGIILLSNSSLPFSEMLQRQSYTLLFRYRAPVQVDEVVIVYLDDDSHRELQQPYDRPWNRGLYAQLVDRLTADEAKAVVFDILFSGPNSDHPDGDSLFAQAIQENGRVILGTEYGFTADGFPSMYAPYYPFSAAAAALGFVQVVPDEDFMVRKHFHVPDQAAADSYSSLTWEAARIAGAPATDDPNNRFQHRWINYYGSFGTIPSVSFSHAVNTSRVPVGAFRNKVVFVGGALKTEFSGMHKDEYYTPYSRNWFEPAVNVQATQFLNLLRGDWLRRLSEKQEVTLILLFGLLLGFGLVLFRPLPATGIAGVVAILCTAAAFFLFQIHRIWFAWLLILAVQLPAALLWSVVYNSMQVYVRSRLYEASLSLYLSPGLVKKFAGNRDLLKPGAKKETLTIFFSDIADFTETTEGMDSDALAGQMNIYFERAVSDCIHATEGTVVKYIGDAIFAFWNAPDPQDDHPRRACEAALRFMELPPQEVNGRRVHTRIGLHTGSANVGNFGSATRIDYTALGDSVNLASRLEGLNKYLGTRILISGATCTNIQDQFCTRFLGRFKLRGFEKAVEVYELTGRLPDRGENQALHHGFHEALSLLLDRHLDEAEIAFQSLLKSFPDDGPIRFYLSRLQDLRNQPPEPDWRGEIEIDQK